MATALHFVGLTSGEAAAKLRIEGPNVLPIRRRPSAWRQWAAQMVHYFAVMLWVAGVLAILAGMPQLGFAIFVVIVLNGTFAFVQEHRAERAGEKLRNLLPRRATVLRDGVPLEIDAAGIVTGDLVLLKAGDRVSADMVARSVRAPGRHFDDDRRECADRGPG